MLSEQRAGARVTEQDRAIGRRDVNALVVASLGGVLHDPATSEVAVLDAAGRAVPEIGDFLASMMACGASPRSARSYALALLRWWRFLAAIEVEWNRVGRVEVRDFVLWMRFVAQPKYTISGDTAGYAPATINHNLAVLKSFYGDRIETGRGPLVNPVPNADHRQGRRSAAHHNPMRPHDAGRRAPLRQKVPDRIPRALPDRLFDALFAVAGCDRDRALLAFYVSTGARASELLGVTTDLVDPGTQRIAVRRKGTERMQWLPASADAFVWLRLYQQHQLRPVGEQALWLTRRSPHGALTYSAARRMLQRANVALGTSWTLHDLRHTAAQRMIDDPRLSLTDVQWVLGHAHLSATQIYLRRREDEIVARVLEHQQSRRDVPRPSLSLPHGAYRPEVLAALLGSVGAEVNG
jgi:site-specific recombinase XerD